MVVEELKNDAGLMNEVATRVGQHLFSENARGKILGVALMLLAEKTASYQQLTKRVSTIDNEVFQRHRLEAGGPNGTPTDTITLLQMAKYANKKVHDAEDTLLRLLKAAIDDRKSQGVQVNLQQNFSGLHEKVPIPGNMDAKQREALRRLGSRLVRAPKTVRALIGKVREDNEKTEDSEDS